MPNFTVTTTLFPTVFTGNFNLQTVIFKNISTSGTIYLINKQNRNDTVSSTVFDMALAPSESFGYSTSIDGFGCIGPWDAISSAVGGVTLSITPTYRPGRTY